VELYITARVTGPNNLSQRYVDRLGPNYQANSNHALPADTSHFNNGDQDGLASVHHGMASKDADPDNPGLGSVVTRLKLGFGHPCDDVSSPAKAAGSPSPPFPVTPRLARGSMVPTPWGTLNPIKRWWQAVTRRDSAEGLPTDPAAGHWQHLGNIRRIVLLTLMLSQTGVATYFMRTVLPYQGTAKLEMLLLAMFAVLFCWVSAGFWTAMAGFLVLIRGDDAFAISHILKQAKPLPADAKTAIVMPICNEDVRRVMAGLRATYESIERCGELAHFDFFVLSDSNQSDIRASELASWAQLCQAVSGFGRIFYRHRRRRVKRKSGNIDDFCRRWGKNYRYMIVLDADSVMSGDCVANLVRLMEGSPTAGIIQTSPIAAGGETLYSRIQQFATRVYGPLFTSGLHYWQLGESHYWGHNAIIRIAPFMQHCALSALPGRGSLAGDILSHDFVEAALMRRAGWSVWIAYDLQGSFEEMPSNLLEELKRDRRWCHGNLMNFRLFMARGMHRVHRAVFATGVMAYLSAPLWFLFLALSTGLLALQTLTEPTYFIAPRQLFPIWPQWHPEKALALFSATATLLFLPKLLGILLVVLKDASDYGGRLRVIASMLLEILFSMLLAPVRMMFHTRFVVAAFLGWAIHWKSPPRGDNESHWAEAFSKHGADMLLGLVWAVGVYLLNPAFLPWLLPIAGGLMLAAPISILSSRVSLGRRCRTLSLFVIPEEKSPPVELCATAAHQEHSLPASDFRDSVVDPFINALACATGSNRNQHRQHSDKHVVASAINGPTALNEQQKNALLDDAAYLSQLHLAVWSAPECLVRWEQT
jgi:membrane glycosyltransferase